MKEYGVKALLSVGESVNLLVNKDHDTTSKIDVTAATVNMHNNQEELKENVFNLFHYIYERYLENIEFIEKIQKNLD